MDDFSLIADHCLRSIWLYGTHSEDLGVAINCILFFLYSSLFLLLIVYADVSDKVVVAVIDVLDIV